MENYVRKVCPFCKTEITEQDTVKVCPACGIPHHEGCWVENHGCTTFGCSEQHYEAQHTNPTNVCTNCGAPLGDGQAFCPKCGAAKTAPVQNICSQCGAQLQDGQAFCPKCGAAKTAPKQNICSKCGAQLQDGQAFCPSCGQPAILAADTAASVAISQFNSNLEKTNEQKKKKPLIIAGICVGVLALILVAVFLIPKLIKTPEDYILMGDYAKAYEIADTNEQDEIIAENNLAVCSKLCVDSLKDSKSFDLRDAWYDPNAGYIVMHVAANNSYGNTVLNYWLYYYSEDDEEWKLWDSYVDLEEEEYSYYDSDDERLDKIIYNIGLDYIMDTMTYTYKLDESSIEHINTLFEENMLHHIRLFPEAVPETEDDED